MRSTVYALAAIALAGILAVISAVFAADLIERRAHADISDALVGAGLTWTAVTADGLQVRLTGTAPSEADRFRALTITGTLVDASRVIDDMQVTPSAPIAPPRFSLELLRNDDGVSMIGLVPASSDRAAIAASVAKAAKNDTVTDMLETAEFAAPPGWDDALAYGLEALALLPRSKISIAADRVAVTSIADTPAAKRKLESELARKTPNGVVAALDIAAPRPVITPFTLRFLLDTDGARFDACSADTPETAAQILAAARAAGLDGKGACTIGLGVPTPAWADAVVKGINAVARLGGGSLTLSDADVALVALEGTDKARFDDIVGELDADLPEVFSLKAVLPELPEAKTGDEGPPEFTATKSPEGQVQLRGRVGDELVRKATESYARSRFGLGNVYGAMRLDDNLPDGWPLRVLTALEALSSLNNGSVRVQPGLVDLRGSTGDADAKARITQLFADKLGEGQNFEIDVTYVEELDPVAALPSPEECVAAINAILTEQKITFEPGSVTLQGDSFKVIDRIADTLKDCPDAKMEIGGHTDSQGREELNAGLSQQRADAVLTALFARRILTANLTAKGYGESAPIAENDTEDGREANRRIEFRLIVPEEEDTADGGPETQGPEAPAAQTEPDPADEPN